MSTNKDLSDISFKVLSSPTDDQLKRVCKCLEEAFAEDDMTLILTDRDPALLGPYMNCVVLAASIEGEIHVAENEEGDIVGVATWFEPGKEFGNSQAQVEGALMPFMGLLKPDLLAMWHGQFLPGWTELTTTSLAPTEHSAPWYLHFLGVVPNQRRRGIATTLINLIKDKSHPAGIPLCLEAASELDVTIYERLGYVRKGQRTFTGIGDSGQFTMHSMINEP